MSQSVNRFPHKREDMSWIQEIVSKSQVRWSMLGLSSPGRQRQADLWGFTGQLA